MSVTKRISSDYLITNKDTAGANVTVSTHTLFVQGNMVVGGNTSVVTKTDTEITDNTILLNKGESGAGVTLVYSGIDIDRGSLNDVGIRWDESLDAWQATEDGVTWKYLLQGSGPGGIANLFDDDTPQLSANLNITTKTLFDTVANVEIRANAAAMGGSGVYTNTIGVANNRKELITKNRALVYSIIL
jgi:hypothetical protein